MDGDDRPDIIGDTAGTGIRTACVAARSAGAVGGSAGVAITGIIVTTAGIFIVGGHLHTLGKLLLSKHPGLGRAGLREFAKTTLVGTPSGANSINRIQNLGPDRKIPPTRQDKHHAKKARTIQIFHINMAVGPNKKNVGQSGNLGMRPRLKNEE